MFLLKMEENRDFSLLQVQSAINFHFQEFANQPANFSGLILLEKWANLSQNVIVLACGDEALVWYDQSKAKEKYWD